VVPVACILKLSKEFIEKMGGKIWVESAENKGSVFKFSIPVGKVCEITV
jgi:signal transduction histidine kinase